MIGPASLLAPLKPLAAYHRAHGVTAKLVDIADLSVALAQIMPGPLAAQTAIAIGYFRHGIRAPPSPASLSSFHRS